MTTGTAWPAAIVAAYERGETVWLDDGVWVASDGTGRPAASVAPPARGAVPQAPSRPRRARVYDPQQIEASNLLYARCPRCDGLLAEDEVPDGGRHVAVAMCANVDGCGWRAWTFAPEGGS